MKNWANLAQTEGVQGYVVVVEDAKVVTPPK
jgi:hypothetical protein